VSAGLVRRRRSGGRGIGKLPPLGAALNRRQSHIVGFWHVFGCGIMAPGEHMVPIFISRGAPIYAKARCNNLPAHISAPSLAGMPKAFRPLPPTSDALCPYRLPIFGSLCHTG
jgi:hypothetical protein